MSDVLKSYDLSYITAPTVVALSDASARSAQLLPDVYELWCEADCYFLQGDSDVEATTASIPLEAKTPRVICVRGASDKYVAGIVASGTPNLFIIPRR